MKKYYIDDAILQNMYIVPNDDKQHLSKLWSKFDLLQHNF